MKKKVKLWIYRFIVILVVTVMVFLSVFAQF